MMIKSDITARLTQLVERLGVTPKYGQDITVNKSDYRRRAFLESVCLSRRGGRQLFALCCCNLI